MERLDIETGQLVKLVGSCYRIYYQHLKHLDEFALWYLS